MKKYLSLLFFLIFSFSQKKVFSQQYYLFQDAKGDLVGEKPYADIEGSPYLTDDWQNGDITLYNGKQFKNLSLKYDLARDVMYVKGQKDETILLNDKIQSFILHNSIIGGTQLQLFKSGYHNIPGTTSNSYFEILAEGKVQLLKHYSKQIQEDKAYNSATTMKTFIFSERYYLLNKNKAFVIKKDKKSILNTLNDKRSLLEEFIKVNRINLKEDTGLIQLIKYYNTI